MPWGCSLGLASQRPSSGSTHPRLREDDGYRQPNPHKAPNRYLVTFLHNSLNIFPHGFIPLGCDWRSFFVKGSRCAEYCVRGLSGLERVGYSGFLMPSFVNRLRRVLGWTFRISAAPFFPPITHLVCWRTLSTYSRSISSNVTS